MVPAWMAVAAWLIAWTALAVISLGFLAKVRPGERTPLLLRPTGEARWMVSPGVAAGLIPVCALISGAVTIIAGYALGGGRAPVMNVLLAGLFVFVHAVYVRRVLAWLEARR